MSRSEATALQLGLDIQGGLHNDVLVNSDKPNELRGFGGGES